LADHPPLGPTGELVQGGSESNSSSSTTTITHKSIIKIKKSEWKMISDWSSCSLACGGGT
jgi:hypothetical protein